MFGVNVLEDDDHKNTLSPGLKKQQKLFDNSTGQPLINSIFENDQMKA